MIKSYLYLESLGLKLKPLILECEHAFLNTGNFNSELAKRHYNIYKSELLAQLIQDISKIFSINEVAILDDQLIILDEDDHGSTSILVTIRLKKKHDFVISVKCTLFINRIIIQAEESVLKHTRNWIMRKFNKSITKHGMVYCEMNKFSGQTF